MEKQSGLEDLNLSRPRRQPLLPGQKPGRGFNSGTEQFQPEADTAAETLRSTSGGGASQAEAELCSQRAPPWAAAPTANRIPRARRRAHGASASCGHSGH